MVNSNADALGIIFPNSYDSLVPELVGERLMASIPFASRYRMVDFILSSMVNCGIGNVSIVVRRNYHSLMDHLGSGREWDLTRKNGGLHIFPPYSDKTVKIYNGRVEALASIVGFLRDQKERYVVMSDANIAVNFDFNALIDAHVKSGADITVAYAEEPIPEVALKSSALRQEMYYTLELEGDRVKQLYINPQEPGIQNFCMNIYILDRELLINGIEKAFMRGDVYFERDIIARSLDRLNVRAFKFDGYIARICDMKSYFDENMKLLDENNLNALFSANPVYTKIRDDNPTRYINGSDAQNIMAADGCVIEGKVENSILFRGVRIGKGAKVKNCVLMQDTVVEEGANLEYIVTDKDVTVTAGKELRGTESLPVYVAKYRTV
ncbi:MAG TPA: glucose-1-phosphate adenylyltransferase subunit GlgD [Candidatus Eisenbergiella merdipullorum]|uniref:Glucose-1-phosphate adenylyltransferase subunit GlgD n=1 Tax=Candidatus Eisenbergiella merdipullorum TaxID=2838553 RepID=A0A9D2I869_9FIRM|nr:glucose-1-phosphate adenylyltransferase subunit GlgD [Candidatus Eisenbergiella merdipullorum]